jgi:hypothetical protein
MGNNSHLCEQTTQFDREIAVWRDAKKLEGCGIILDLPRL